MSRPYTVIYIVTGPRTGLHNPKLCFHHWAHVTADDPVAAQSRCKADTLPGYEYKTLLVFEGHLAAVVAGHPILVHTFEQKDPP